MAEIAKAMTEYNHFLHYRFHTIIDVVLLWKRVARLVSYWARPTRGVLDRALREQVRLTGHLLSAIIPSLN